MTTEVVLAVLFVLSIIFLLFIYAQKQGYLPKYENFTVFETDKSMGIRGIGGDYFKNHILI
jgi:hypothetical protein